MAGDEQEILARHTPYRNDQTSAFSELREQGLWHMRCCRSNEDAMVRCMRGQAKAAIANHDLDIGIPQTLQHGAGTLGQIGEVFDTVYVPSQATEYCRL